MDCGRQPVGATVLIGGRFQEMRLPSRNRKTPRSFIRPLTDFSQRRMHARSELPCLALHYFLGKGVAAGPPLPCAC